MSQATSSRDTALVKDALSVVGKERFRQIPREVKAGTPDVWEDRVAIVKAINDNTLTCAWLDGNLDDGTVESSFTFEVAKPHELRLEIATLQVVEGVTRTWVNPQELSATDGTDTETWKITPSYVVDFSRIVVGRTSPASYKSAATEELVTLYDTNGGGRAWAVEP